MLRILLGRLDRIVYLGPPNRTERKEMIELLSKKMPFDITENDLETILNRTEGYSYSDIKSLCREAALSALRENIEATSIDKNHFAAAFMKHKISPTSSKLTEIYKNFNQSVSNKVPQI